MPMLIAVNKMVEYYVLVLLVYVLTLFYCMETGLLIWFDVGRTIYLGEKFQLSTITLDIYSIMLCTYMQQIGTQNDSENKQYNYD